MSTAAGAFLIDWEQLSIGHREWDQATAAWHRDVFGASPDDYTAFARVYGHDVTTWPSYQVIRDIRSLCTTLFALRHATAIRQAAPKRTTAWRACAELPAPPRSRGAPVGGNGPARRYPKPYWPADEPAQPEPEA
ncbi:hypothetical protein ACFYZ4_11585 [Streptomyces sp. NPDC001513]|uniref:hypothetical protein n=1 Tax=Streptomyces sp. NPDC001513 TaxID=3364580 RepID=UPI003692233A